MINAEQNVFLLLCPIVIIWINLLGAAAQSLVLWIESALAFRRSWPDIIDLLAVDTDSCIVTDQQRRLETVVDVFGHGTANVCVAISGDCQVMIDVWTEEEKKSILSF